MIKPSEVRKRIANGETFVVNVVTEWCPDCTQRQRPYFPKFVEDLKAEGIPTYQLTVQHERKVFLSDEHQSITELFGGPGYPRTVLIIKGKIQEDSRVEVITPEGLSELATEFIRKKNESPK